ncbi:MAG TPA: ABC transporter permease [Fimbriiglobus sp.]|jgi:ABC-type transport system involved in multi-copper enzyme maturation permease subunit
MNLPTAIRTIRWMVRDTFRQAVASKLAWVMLAVTAVCTFLCFSVRVSGDMPRTTHPDEIPKFITKAEMERIGAEKVKADGIRVLSGEVSFGFGAVTVPLGRSRDDAVKFLQLWMAGIVADTVGILLALLWTAGFLPTFLDPHAVTVLLAKPVPRWTVLLGKYLGVVLFVTVQASLFVFGTWLALGISTGVWSGGYWLAVPLLAVSFGIFYSISTFLAVWTRSAVACAFGTILIWMLCWAMNFTHHRLAIREVEGVGGGSVAVAGVGYWVLPKPLDLGGVFYDAMGAEAYAQKVPELKALQDKGKYSPELSVLASCLFAAAVLAMACFEFRQTDY